MDIEVLSQVSQYGQYAFAGLATIGFVNVLSIFYPNLDSRHKILFTVLAAFAFTFIPASVGDILYDHSMTAIKIVFSSSGVYKLFTKSGGNS